MALSRKDFNALAEMIQRNTTEDDHHLLKYAFLQDLMDFMEDQNPKFDRKRFWRAATG